MGGEGYVRSSLAVHNLLRFGFTHCEPVSELVLNDKNAIHGCTQSKKQIITDHNEICHAS